jgi:hypothetical protein
MVAISFQNGSRPTAILIPWTNQRCQPERAGPKLPQPPASAGIACHRLARLRRSIMDAVARELVDTIAEFENSIDEARPEYRAELRRAVDWARDLRMKVFASS